MALYKWDTKISWIGSSFAPSNVWSNWQVLKRTSNWYEWEDEDVTSVEWKTGDVNVIDAVTETEYNNLPSTKTTDGVWRVVYE